MTQQGDMTSQPPGTGQPGDSAGRTPAEALSQPAGPYWPSPYLAEGQSVPDAYPAPARPGQPRYGDPAAHLRAGPQGRAGRAGFSRPAPPGGLVRPGPGAQASQPGLTAPAARPAGPADTVLASAWERLLAMTMDWLLILVASFLLLHQQMFQLVHRFQAVMVNAQTLGPKAETTALTNFIKSPATVSAQTGYWLMAFLLALAYFWALEARGGATLGKRVLGLRVVRAADRSPAGVWLCGARTLLFLTGPATFALSAPRNFLPGVAIISLLGVALWVADSLVLATDPQKRSLHDKLAGTLVVRKAPQRGNS